MEKAFAERTRRAMALALLWFGWLGTAALVALRTFGVLDQRGGSIAIFTIGVAVAATVTRSRMRLRDTIIDTYKAGMNAAELKTHYVDHE